MKTQIVNKRFLMFGFSFFVSLVLFVVPASATDFEVGTRFGISHFVPNGKDAGSFICLKYHQG